MTDYPYVQFLARDANDNPIDIKLQASSDSVATDEAAIVDAVRDFLTGLPGVTLQYVTRFAVTGTPA
ncbi:hypothetical protein [Streptomyces sp. NPDC056105]|uniref:hypothetical protein n=1 Tax=Streptomyces sp. NPDC056105 TaxID=3345714 RepID=UPI0035DC8B23